MERVEERRQFRKDGKHWDLLKIFSRGQRGKARDSSPRTSSPIL